MHAFLALGTTAFLLCLVMTPVCRDIFLRADILDRPDGDRKFHVRAVPRMGGIPIALSYAGALLLLFAFGYMGGRSYILHGQFLPALLPAAGIIFLTGLLDDIRGLKPWQKLAGQIVASALAVSLGAHLSLPHLPLWISIGVSFFWLIACTNAINLIDGMDGLATGVSLLATLTTLLVALLSHNFGLVLITIPLAACLLAFLRYNFSPASVFLGDCGSLTIGFVLGCCGLIWSRNTGTLLGMAAPLMALALPLIDVGLAIGRRFLRSVPITQADRGHIHHMVLALGFSTRGAALVLYAVCGLCASLAMLASFSHDGYLWPILVVFCSLVLIGIDRLGYVEFSAARKTLSHQNMRRAVQEEIYLQELTRDLLDADTVETCWEVVRTTCSDLNFASAHLEWHGRSFIERFIECTEEPGCRIQLSLGEHGCLMLTRVTEKAPPRIMMAVLDRLQASISSKTPTLHTAPIMQLPTTFV